METWSGGVDKVSLDLGTFSGEIVCMDEEMGSTQHKKFCQICKNLLWYFNPGFHVHIHMHTFFFWGRALESDMRGCCEECEAL